MLNSIIWESAADSQLPLIISFHFWNRIEKQNVNATALKGADKKGKNDLKYEHEQCFGSKHYQENVL